MEVVFIVKNLHEVQLMDLYLFCSLGKRKASERVEGADSQEPRHTKRTAIDAPAETVHAVPDTSNRPAQSNGITGLEQQHQQSQSQTRKHAAEAEQPDWQAAERDSSSAQRWQQSGGSFQQPSTFIFTACSMTKHCEHTVT